MVAIAGTGWRLAPSLVAFVKEADRWYPQRDRRSDGSIGDLSHQANVSDHNPSDGYVHAVDLDEDLAPGLDLRTFAEQLRVRRDSRVKYVIYEGRMFSSYGSRAWLWRPYSGVNAHRHHLHLSILHTDRARQDLTRWGFAPPTPKPPAPPTPLEDNIMQGTVLRRRGTDDAILTDDDVWYMSTDGGITSTTEVVLDESAWAGITGPNAKKIKKV